MGREKDADSVKGATGEAVGGYLSRMASLFLLGREFEDVLVLTYDFKNFPGVDGLLGWDVIQNLHVEMNGLREGVEGVLKDSLIWRVKMSWFLPESFSLWRAG